MQTADNFSALLEQIAIKHGISNDSIIAALQQSIEEILGYKIISNISVGSNSNISFLGENDKKITLSPLLQKRIRNIFLLKINEQIAKQAKINKIRIVEGTILKAMPAGLQILTKDGGEAFAPRQLLVKGESKMGLYQEGFTLTFHVHRFGKQLILDRQSNELIRELFVHKFPDIHIYRINRVFGKQIKAYVSNIPTKEEINEIKLHLCEKKIDFIQML